MTFLTQLDVINDMLGSLGEVPINVLEEDGAYVSAGIRMLRVANIREQSKSWWFNKELMLLTPDAASGMIYLPDDGLRVDPVEEGLNYALRGRRLYNMNAGGTDPYVFSAPVQCWVVRLLAFEDLPAPAQSVVSFAAQKDFQKAYDADRAKFDQLTQEYRLALMTLNAEHTRNQRVNLLHRASTAGTLASIAPNAQLRGHHRFT